MTPLDFLDLGIAVIPIGYRSKRPHRGLLPGGKWEVYQSCLPPRGWVESWAKRPLMNAAVVTGWQNLVIVDFDNPGAHDLWLATYGRFSATYTVQTGRGFHYYYFMEQPPEYTKKWVGGEIKVTGYCLIPPSTHPSGRKYTAVSPDVPIMTIKSIDDILPAGLFDTPPVEPPRGQVDPFNPPMPGGSYDTARQVDLMVFFDDPRQSTNGHVSVFCPFHGDGEKRGKRSGWVNTKNNRFGCHVCLNGTLGAIDFYMKLRQVDESTAVDELLAI